MSQPLATLQTALSQLENLIDVINRHSPPLHCNLVSVAPDHYGGKTYPAGPTLLFRSIATELREILKVLQYAELGLIVLSYDEFILDDVETPRFLNEQKKVDEPLPLE